MACIPFSEISPKTRLFAALVIALIALTPSSDKPTILSIIAPGFLEPDPPTNPNTPPNTVDVNVYGVDTTKLSTTTTAATEGSKVDVYTYTAETSTYGVSTSTSSYTFNATKLSVPVAASTWVTGVTGTVAPSLVIADTTVKDVTFTSNTVAISAADEFDTVTYTLGEAETGADVVVAAASTYDVDLDADKVVTGISFVVNI